MVSFIPKNNYSQKVLTMYVKVIEQFEKMKNQHIEIAIEFNTFGNIFFIAKFESFVSSRIKFETE